MPIYAVYRGNGVSQLIQTDEHTTAQAESSSYVRWDDFTSDKLELVGEFWADNWEEAKIAYEAILWGEP